jgi:hypothetical protein
MIYKSILALAVLAPFVVPQAAALAVTGSGTVSFSFTGFSGPIANISANAVGAAPWPGQGRFNNVLGTPDGGFIPSPSNPAFGVATGTATFAHGTTSVAYRYDNVAPGSIGENLLSFAPAAFTNVGVGQPFLLGTLTYKNGFWFGAGDTPASNIPSVFSFSITTIADGPFAQTTTGIITNVVNQLPLAVDQIDTPSEWLAEADWIYVTETAGGNLGIPLGALRVYDNCCRPTGFTTVGSIELWGRFGSLDLVELRNPQGGVFTTSIGALDPGGPVAPAIPEPSSWAMLIAGFGLTGAVLRRRRVLAAA